MQPWTSLNGNVVQAEMMRFDGDKVVLRTANGKVLNVADTQLAPHHQVSLLKLRLESLYVKKRSSSGNFDYYQSRAFPTEDVNKHVSGYLTFEEESCRMGVWVNLPGVDLAQYQSVRFSDGEDGQAAVGYEASDVQSFNDNSGSKVTINVAPDRNPEVATVILEGARSKKLVVELINATGRNEKVRLTPESLVALYDLTSAYTRIAELQQTGAWTGKLAAPLATAEPDEALRAFAEQRTQPQFGELSWKGPDGQIVRAPGLGYLGADVVLRTGIGKVQRANFAGFPKDQQTKMLETRLREHFDTVSANGLTAFYHKDWDDDDRKWKQTLVLLRVDATGQPILRAQGWTARFNGQPFDGMEIWGDSNQRIAIEVQPGDSTIEQGKDGAYSMNRSELRGEALDAALQLLGTTSIKTEWRSGNNRSTPEFDKEELAASLEAIACYQWMAEVAN